ncbi:S8 family serine peptidase [Silvanigrella paludirubra]|uniref:S8 family serine peptidase n=1 Tax=Silvanigrella paludirubra TaxID=2499159 RepID=A0A6N6VXF1_9BACT|nr:S8 family serine peptidase [Silvanigrella paludirubra]KAB8038695.1 S8 family serine peptidase [Silvanigrella paludirubra]
MSLNRNYFAFLSISVIAVSFLSACGKNSNNDNKSNDAITQNNSTQEALNDKYCTDLSDGSKNPLGKFQWHLKNTGQRAFATEGGVAGEDINAEPALKDECLSGNGVSVAVVDSGMQIIHPSLKPNIDGNSKAKSINFRDNRLQNNDPSPIPEDDEDHGTMVSGIIAMRSNLGFGGSGVAPRAKLAGYNIIQAEAGVQQFQNFVDSLGGSDFSKGNDIFNMSYGDNNLEQISSDDPITLGAITAYKYGTRHLRNGKGALYVKAAGNGFTKLGRDRPSIEACKMAIKLGVTCQNSSMNTDNTIPEVITVGAISAKGKKTSYSTTGSSLWISAPGGEFGFDKNWIDSQYARFSKTVEWQNLRPSLGEPAIVTTDVMGSRYGMSKIVNFDSEFSLDDVFSIRNSFNAGYAVDNEGRYLNSEYNYTNTMNGTSSATPVTSGSLALILEANPNLTWRDVKYILAKTATKVDPNFAGVKVKIANGEDYQAEDGWTKNAAGFNFSNWYGFGRINVGEAVKLAKNYNVNLGTYTENNWYPLRGYATNLAVAPGATGLIYKIPSIPKAANLKIESLRAEVSVDSDYIGDVGLELTSPSGTKSIIWNIGNAFSSNGNLVNMPIQSNAFYGENSAGVWTLRVINSGLNAKTVSFKGIRLQIAGQKVSL